MQKYNYKNLNEVQPILGFNKSESAILHENGIISKEQLREMIPDNFNQLEINLKDFLWKHCYLTGVAKFKEIIERFKDKKICLIGDYDVDGLMGTTILKLTLNQLGYDTFHIIPNRIDDGFALKPFHVDKAIEGGASLIITVDNGTSGVEAIKYAKEKGLTVIITDHHLCETELPEADLIINPHINHDSFEDICGAVVAMKIAAYMLKENRVIDNRIYELIFDLGAIATVGDMMPVIGENRMIIKLGLQSINKIKDDCRMNTIGKLLCGMADTNYMNVYNFDKNITEETLAYYICPVLNATSRIEGDVNHVVNDILNCEYIREFELRGYREKNKERKKRTREIAAKHKENPSKSVDITVLKETDFEYPISGLVGLLANRISNSEHKPCFVGYIPKDGNICKFSGRSVNNYSIYSTFQRLKNEYPELQLNGGGHDGAMGIEMPISSIEKFEELICADYDNYDYSEDLPNVYILADDKEIEEVTSAHFRMAPFGENFKKLKFMTRGKITNKLESVNMVIVNGFEFKAYTLLSNLPDVGKDVNVYFSISFGNKMFSEFKIEEIEEV